MFDSRDITQAGLILFFVGFTVTVVFNTPRELFTSITVVGFLSIIGGWITKPKSKPPVTFIGWLLTGDNPPYSEMGDVKLQQQAQWMHFKLQKKDSMAGVADRLLGFHQFKEYDVSELEEEIRNCRDEIRERGLPDPLRVRGN